MVKFLVSMLGLNRESGTREAVEAVLKSTEDFHLVLTNQASSDGTGKYFDQVKKRHPDKVTVFHEKENTFFQPPNARAFRMAAQMGCKYFVALNDDALIPPHGLTMLAEPLDASPTAALSGPQGGCQELSHSMHGQPGVLHFIEGSCLCVKIEAVQRCRSNLWNEHLRGIYSEDSELSLFMQERGYTIHKVAFDLPHARSSTVNRTPEIQAQCKAFQDANHEYTKKRYAYWLEHRTFALPIVLKREYAIGDVILITPIIDAIRKSRPLSPIHVQTKFPELFASDPRVASCGEHLSISGPKLEINLDGAYENRPLTHIVDAYWQAAAEVITGLEPHEWVTRLHPSPDDLAWAEKRLNGREKILVCAPDPTTWISKNWPQERMAAVANKMKRQGWYVVAIGSKDRMLPIWADLNLVGSTTLMQTAAVCARAHCVVTPDSSALHLAQAVGCPTVGLFGVTRSRYITTRGGKCAAVECPDGIPGAGQRHKVSGQTFVDVGSAVMEAITVEDVMGAITKLEL